MIVTSVPVPVAVVGGGVGSVGGGGCCCGGGAGGVGVDGGRVVVAARVAGFVVVVGARGAVCVCATGAFCVVGRVSGLRLHDLNCGLKAYRAEVVRGLRLYGELHRFVPVLAHYRGYRVAELPVNHRAREHGRSRYGLERYLRGFLDLLTVSFMGRYRHRPLHLFGGLGLLLGTVGAGVLVYLTVLKALGHAIGQRPLLTLGVLLVVVGLQFFSLGLIGEMITSHHEERAQERERAELLVDEILS